MKARSEGFDPKSEAWTRKLSPKGEGTYCNISLQAFTHKVKDNLRSFYPKREAGVEVFTHKVEAFIARFHSQGESMSGKCSPNVLLAVVAGRHTRSALHASPRHGARERPAKGSEPRVLLL